MSPLTCALIGLEVAAGLAALWRMDRAWSATWGRRT
jgi:hypothetical protein